MASAQDAAMPDALAGGSQVDDALIESGRQRLLDFLKSTVIESIIPESGKVIVFDVRLPIKIAFFALVEHEVTSAPLWQEDVKQHVGILTASDFIDVLRHYHSIQPDSMEKVLIPKELENQRIHQWRDIKHKGGDDKLIGINPESSLFEACTRMRDNRLHRLPVVQQHNETSCVLFVVTHWKLLKFLAANFAVVDVLQNFVALDLTIGQLKLGTWSNVLTLARNSRTIDVLDIMASHSISAVPILNDDGTYLDLFARADVRFLVKEEGISLTIPVSQVLDLCKAERHVGATVTRNATLRTLLDKFVRERIRRVIVVDEASKVEGVVALSDIFRFFLG